MKYSTEEQVVGVWIDGKPIYQRSFNIKVEKYGVQMESGYIIPDLDTVCTFDYVMSRNDKIWYGANHGENVFDKYYINYVRINGNGLVYFCAQQWYQTTRFIVTVRYTKK